MVIDQDGDTVVHVADGRGRDTLNSFFEGFPETQRKTVSLSMDMWGAYIASVTEAIPGAEHKIAFDRFHVAGHKAFDRVRRQEHKETVGTQGQLVTAVKRRRSQP